MAAAVLPMRGFNPGLSTLLLQVATGAIIYGTLAAVFDLAGLRSLTLAHLPARWRRTPALPPVDRAA